MSPTEIPAETDRSGAKSMDDIMALCKRRGFVYQASEIYGGINGFWDYGPLGAQLKKNLRDAWWQDVVMTSCRGATGPDGRPVRIVPVDTCIIQNPRVWEASGHVAGFNDPRVDCRECKSRFRADQVFAVGFWRLDSLPPKKAGELRTLAEQAKSANASAREAYNECISRMEQPTLVKYVVASGRDEATTSTALTKTDLKELQRIDPKAHLDDEYVVAAHPIDADGNVPVDFVPTRCPNCGGTLTEPRPFNLMFPTVVGATGDAEDDKAYLRPETAQGIFVQFKNVVDTTRVRVPFGIAQTGKAFRNEVTPRNFTFRSREFEQMEIEFFCHPSETGPWYTFWRDWRMSWWESLGLAGDNLRLREHDSDELAHYAKDGAGTSDIEYRFPFTYPDFGELEGIADRTDFDLRQHQEHAGVKLDYFDTERGELAKNGQPKGERYLPHVIEPSAGLDRGVLAILCEAYTPDPERPSKVYMKFHPRVAPIKAAVFPLVNKDGMPEKAAALRAELVQRFGHLGFIEFDEKQSIGKRYARMDEAGCPFCFTIDGQTLEDGTVTVRNRDTLAQERIAADNVAAFLAEKLGL